MTNQALFGLTPDTIIRDSLYDLIPLPDEAARILSTPAFLRLDGIQQLGFVSRIWPGARHTRFEHSLGVMHLMREALERIVEHGAPLNEETARTAIAAALLHDIGHYPFSHAIEELGPPIPTHEEVGRGIILRSDVATILHEDWRVDPERVANLIEPGETELCEQDCIVYGLLSGPLDVDKLDYLPRDARACHVPYGGVDTSRLLDALRVIQTEEGPAVGIDQKGVSPLHSLTNARQEMFDNVYWHHTNRACMAMLLRAVQDALTAGLPPEELTHHTDVSLLERLLEPDLPETTRTLVDGLRNRRFHKRAIEISYLSGSLHHSLNALFHDPPRRRGLERTIAATVRRETGLPVSDADVLIDIPKPERWHTSVRVQYDQPPVGFLPVMTWQEVTGVSDVNLRTYEEHRRLIRIVTTAPLRESVRAIWEDSLMPLMTAP